MMWNGKTTVRHISRTFREGRAKYLGYNTYKMKKIKTRKYIYTTTDPIEAIQLIWYAHVMRNR